MDFICSSSLLIQNYLLGSPVPARDILGGRVPPPEVASRLYEVIEAAEGLDESGLPESAYVPDETGGHVPVRAQETVFDAGADHLSGGL